MTHEELKQQSRDLPQTPGVYLFLNKNKKIIYVGKAKNLRSRVGSYFNIKIDKRSKTYALVNKINDINIIETESEFEALLLEAELIKKHLPHYNIILKDDKSYIYIVIRADFVKFDFGTFKLPKVITARKTTIKPKDSVFGPYPNGSTVKNIVKVLRRVFPLRDCSLGKFNKYKKLKNPCLYGHINLCSVPCLAVNKGELSEYKKNVRKVEKLLAGKTSALLRGFNSKMKKLSKERKYEEAQKYKDLLIKFDYIRQNFRDATEYIDNPHLLEDIQRTSLEKLKVALPYLTQKLNRIECYDISNISGKEAVGSMVVATNGKIDKSEYKKFKIKLKDTPDDFDMMYEVLYRRFNNKWPKPDLIVLDGGKGQVSAGLAAMEDAGVRFPLIGLAKKEELLVYKGNNKSFKELKLPQNNEGLKLLINLRNEAHRFAQAYHHKLRLKTIRSK